MIPEAIDDGVSPAVAPPPVSALPSQWLRRGAAPEQIDRYWL